MALEYAGMEIRVHQQTPTMVRLSVLLKDPNITPWALSVSTGQAYLLLGRSASVALAKAAPPPLVGIPVYTPWRLRVEESFSPWLWEKGTQVMASSHPHLPQTELGTRLSTQGKCLVPVPLLRAYALGYVEHQTLYFQDATHDYGDVLSSFALTHPLLGPLQIYEGAALIYRQGLAEKMERTDSSWFMGLALTHRQWFGTLTLERYQDQAPGGSYYSQTLRGGLRQDFAASTVLLQGSLQRVDPVIRQAPMFRGSLYASYDRYFGKTTSLGLQAYWGIPPFGSGDYSRLDIGPVLRIRF